MKKLYLGIVTLALLLGCGDNNASSDETSTTENEIEEISQQPGISDDLVKDILQAIPSPLEISTLIREVSQNYNPSVLNEASSSDNYTTNYSKAINLGIYGTDLGYANIYGKTQDAIKYLNSVRDLADGLSIGEFFDYSTMKRLADSSDNLDSLLLETTNNFNKINYHLRQQKREHLSILILTGGWVEAVYLTCLVHEQNNNQLLKEKIGEQKIVLDQILLVLDVYKSKPNFKGLIDDLTALQQVYDTIEIETVYAQPTTEEGPNGQLIVVDNTTSEVKVTNADVETITSLTKSIRNKMIR